MVIYNSHIESQLKLYQFHNRMVELRSRQVGEDGYNQICYHKIGCWHQGRLADGTVSIHRWPVGTIFNWCPSINGQFARYLIRYLGYAKNFILGISTICLR
jgi:hypothetical protein